MVIEYRDHTSRTLAVEINNPHNPEEREAALCKLVSQGARFAGNCAGWSYVGNEWVSTPTGHTRAIGNRRVMGEILVTSQGLPNAFGRTGPRKTTTLYVYEQPNPGQW